MLTGDRRSVADSVAREIGVDEWRADCLPEQKLES
jgi:cation transport ATPase